MGADERYDERYSPSDRERWVAEQPKRVVAPERTPFERDRARVVHSAALRRLAAKTQVVGPGTDDFVRNRLTHSLEVAQIARDLAHPVGCHPDLAETAALAHDLGHPPFGHNGERVLDRLATDCGGFEGNAQTLRILTRLEAKSVGPGDRSIGLNLTRATLDACTKYPWRRGGPSSKFGVYDADLDVFRWLRDEGLGERRCLEAQVMDLADDVAYSVHDLEDGIVAERIGLERLESASERSEVWETVRDWYDATAGDDRLDAAWERLHLDVTWPTSAYDGSRGSLAALKDLTSDVIGVFCGSVQAATRAAYGDGPLVRYDADLVVPTGTRDEIAVLKGIAAHYVMRADDRLALMERQAVLVEELFVGLRDGSPDLLDRTFRDDLAAAEAAGDGAARTRVLLDQVASLTDASAVARHALVTGG